MTEEQVRDAQRDENNRTFDLARAELAKPIAESLADVCGGAKAAEAAFDVWAVTMLVIAGIGPVEMTVELWRAVFYDIRDMTRSTGGRTSTEPEAPERRAAKTRPSVSAKVGVA